MRSVRLLCVACITSLAIGFASMAHAAVAIDLAAGGTDFTNGNWSLGFEFTANSSITVTHLGFYDDGGNGFAGDHEVGIWDTAGNLLASGTVVAGDTLIDSFRYTAIAPLVLSAGTNYIIAAVTGAENYYFGAPVTTPPEVTYITDRYASDTLGSGLLDFPEDSDALTPANAGYFGPNFQFDAAAVPEPMSMAIWGLGAVGLFGVRRLRRKKA